MQRRQNSSLLSNACRRRKLASGVNGRWIFATAIKDNDVSKAVYEDFLPKTLAEGKYVAAPDPHVVGKGLEYV
jgi:hypothetical protein